MPKTMPRADFDDIANDLRCGDSLMDVANRYGYSYAHVSKCNVTRRLLDSGDLEGLMDAYNKKHISVTMYSYASETLFARRDEAAQIEAARVAKEKDEENRRVNLENAAVDCESPMKWFGMHTNLLPELSAIFKTLAVAIDTMLECYNREGSVRVS